LDVTSDLSLLLVEGLRGIEEQVGSLLETFEIASDKKLLRNIKASLREAQRGRGRTMREILPVKRAPQQSLKSNNGRVMQI
jgi:hypothetical protein